MNLDKFIFTVLTDNFGFDCVYTVALPHLSKYTRKIEILGDLDILDRLDEHQIVEVKRLGQCSYKITYLEVTIPSKVFRDYQQAKNFVRRNWNELVSGEKTILEPKF